jgi:hypothetical protein
MLRWRPTDIHFCFRFEGGEKLRGHHLRGALNHPMTHTGDRAAQLKIAGLLVGRAVALFFQI